MFRVTRKTIVTENEIHIGYGIECDKYCFDDISTDRDKIERLCHLCNSLELSDDHLKDVVEDFLFDLKVD